MSTDAIRVCYCQGRSFRVARNYDAGGENDEPPEEAGDGFVWCARFSMRDGVLAVISGYLTACEIFTLIASMAKWNRCDADVDLPLRYDLLD